MSYIRASTKVPGQKNLSRTYAYWDVSGGIVIHSREGTVRISIPEFHYMTKNFLDQFNKYDRRLDGKNGKTELVSVEQALRRAHRGFFKAFDEQAEKGHRADMKLWNARIARSQKRQKRQIAKTLAKWKREMKSPRFKAEARKSRESMVEAEVVRILAREKIDAQRGKK